MNDDVLDQIDSIAKKMSKDGKNITIWDVLVEFFSESSNLHKSYFWIISDLPIIEGIVKGYGIDYISNKFNVSISYIKKLSRIWGLYVFDETLDFDPLSVKGYSNAYDLKRHVVSFMDYSDDIFEKCINNVKKYKDIIAYLDNFDKERI